MTLRRFLDIAYALLVEEYQRLGQPLLTAIESASEWGARTIKPEETPQEREEAEEVRRNQESLKRFKEMMGEI
jgi:hypothetical protein